MRTARVGLVLALCMAFAAANIYQVDFEKSDNEMNLEVKRGDLLRVNLKENPSTGYVWRFQAPQQNKLGIYSVQMDDFTEAKSNSNSTVDETPVGMAGHRTVVLRADKEGRDEFELVLVRTWEFKDFIDSNAGQPLKMKDVPNAGYRKLILTVRE